MSGWEIKTSSGRPLTGIVERWKARATPTAGDAMYAGQLQRARILRRTGQGVDVNGQPFDPYSTKGPYYYNPNGRLGASAASRIHVLRQKAAAKRLLHKITTAAERKQSDAPRLSSTGRTIRFASYSALKRWLGRKVVDLRGPRAPNMLQGILVKVGAMTISGRANEVGLNAHPQPADFMRLGIYGEMARRATGHNNGTRVLPKRRFFDATVADLRQMKEDMLTRMRLRLRKQ